jgi:hypothetical protein
MRKPALGTLGTAYLKRRLGTNAQGRPEYKGRDLAGKVMAAILIAVKTEILMRDTIVEVN